MARRSRAGNRASRAITDETSQDLSLMIGKGLGIEEVKQLESGVKESTSQIKEQQEE